MKKTIIAALVLCSSITALARSPIGLREASLTQFNLDPAYSLKKENIRAGMVQVDLLHKEVTVSLQRLVLCNPGMLCSQRAYPPIIFAAELVDTKVGGCGETIYTAVTDKTRGDGARVSIQVTDNSKNVCMYMVAIPKTEVKVLTETLRPRETLNHSFEASTLNPALP